MLEGRHYQNAYISRDIGKAIAAFRTRSAVEKVIYPDAQLVMTHRDPVEAVGSACSLIKHVRVMFSDRVDPLAIGQTVLNTFDKMIERTLAYRERHGWDSIYDLQYAALLRDPVSAMKKLYEHFADPLTPATAAAMAAHLADNPQGKHGQHKYSLQEYGFTREQVRAHFREYCRRFEIPCRD